MFRTVQFGDYDSYTDFALILASHTIGEAAPRTNSVEVEGMDGSLDLTEYFGEVFYSNRELSFTFSLIEPVSEFPRIYSEVKNAIHGRRMKIRLGWDSGFYYVGRVTVSEWQSNGRIGSITVTADCEPYKYKVKPTTKTFKVEGSKTVILSNLRKRVSPQFESDAVFTVKQGDESYTASQGVWSDARIILQQGDNRLDFEGNATITVTYQERGL